MSSAPTDKKKTERSVASVSTAFNDTKLRKTPSAGFPKDGTIVSGGFNATSSGIAAKSPGRAKVIVPSTLSKLTQASQSQQPQPSQTSARSDTQASSSPPPNKSEAPPQSVVPASAPVPAPAPAPTSPGNEAANESPLTLRSDTGMKIEFVLGLLGSGILISLWIFLMTADCYEKKGMVFWVKTFALIGTAAGIFVAIYCCFERSISPARGFASCIYISFLAMVGGLNLIGAYLSTTCICTCHENPIKDSNKEDLVIFLLELLGALCILGVILVASLTRPII